MECIVSPSAEAVFGSLTTKLITAGVVRLVFDIIVLIGAIMINSEKRDKVRIGSILTLTFSF